MEQEVIFNGQILTLTRFWATGEPCLWITDPEQIGMPKMEFVGGHPDEYCIFLKNLTETELAQITSLDGVPVEVKEELQQHLTGKDKPYGTTRSENHASPLAGPPGDRAILHWLAHGLWGGLHIPIWRLAGHPFPRGADGIPRPLSRADDLEGLLG